MSLAISQRREAHLKAFNESRTPFRLPAQGTILNSLREHLIQDLELYLTITALGRLQNPSLFEGRPYPSRRSILGILTNPRRAF